MIDISKYLSILNNSCPAKRYGKVTKVVGLVINGVGVSTRIGDLCEIYSSHPNNGEFKEIKAQVVGFADGEILLMPLDDIHGIRPSDKIMTTNMPLSVWTGDQLLGRAVDALGKPIDDMGKIPHTPEKADMMNPSAPMQRYPVYSTPPQPFQRKRISEPLATGVRAIDGLLTCGKGQRVGIFSGSGLGKSILMGMIARNTNADVNVIALIGERGREVQDFIEKNLGAEGLARSVVVVATSDQPPLIRSIGASTAMGIAEYFRDQGKAVLFMMDSITRYAMAEREIGLATGEPPTTKGYTPSVFAKLPKLLERAGTTLDGGTITGLYTVLVEADDMSDPIGDSMRALLDGHIVLSRNLAERNHYPAIEITQSLSRLMVDIVGTEHREAAGLFRETVAIYNDSKDLIDIGAYTPGNNPRIDYAVEHMDAINNYLRQSIEERADFEDSISRLVNLLPNHNVGL
jgi:flagellum-specific ATP synthase